MPRSLVIKIVGDASSLNKALHKSDSRLKKTTRAAGLAGAAIGGALVAGLGKSVKEALEAEKSQARLEQAFKGARVAIKPYRKEIEQAGKAAINLGFDDEALTDSLGSLIVATGSYEKAQKASTVAMDLARFKGVSLDEATKSLTMAMAGSQRAVRQLGISVSPLTTEYDRLKAKFGENVTESEKLQLANAKLIDKQATAAKTIEIVSAKVGGQAQAYSETAAGGMERFRAKTEELQEMVGEKLLPVLTRVIDKFLKLAGYLEKHPNLVKALVVSLGALTVALLSASVAQTALNLAVLANPYVAATVALIAMVAAVTALYIKVKQLRPVIEQIALTFVGLPLPLRLAVLAFGGLEESMQKVAAVANRIKAAVQWLIDKIPDVPSLPKPPGWLDPRNIGDAPPSRYKQFMGGTGPGSISPALFDELSSARSMGLTLTSGYRPGAVTKHGTPSDHGVFPAKAIDVAGSSGQMARFFSSLIGNRGVKQAFYDPLGAIFGGALSGYREGGHSDHVHVATYAKGGIFNRPTLGVIGEAGPEAVIPLARGLTRGWSGSRPLQVNLQLDGRTLASILVDPLRNELRQVQRAGGSF